MDFRYITNCDLPYVLQREVYIAVNRVRPATSSIYNRTRTVLLIFNFPNEFQGVFFSRRAADDNVRDIADNVLMSRIRPDIGYDRGRTRVFVRMVFGWVRSTGYARRVATSEEDPPLIVGGGGGGGGGCGTHRNT